MRTLFLLRHAKSSWVDQTLPDEDRPLAPRGRRDAKRIAKHLARLGIEPELVLCSSALRTRETLELVRPTLGPTPTVSLEAGLYAASSNVLLERIRAVPEPVDWVMLIGHNPGLQQLAVVLASDSSELAQLEATLPTAALATLTLAKTSWSQLSRADALLAGYVVPKLLG